MDIEKRKRGRPRKHPKVESLKHLSPPPLIPTLQEEPPSTVKKPRGRPRKIRPVLQPEVESSSLAQSSNMNSSSSANSESEINTNPLMDSNQDINESATDRIDISVSQDVDKVKDIRVSEDVDKVKDIRVSEDVDQVKDVRVSEDVDKVKDVRVSEDVDKVKNIAEEDVDKAKQGVHETKNAEKKADSEHQAPESSTRKQTCSPSELYKYIGVKGFCTTYVVPKRIPLEIILDDENIAPSDDDVILDDVDIVPLPSSNRLSGLEGHSETRNTENLESENAEVEILDISKDKEIEELGIAEKKKSQEEIAVEALEALESFVKGLSVLESNTPETVSKDSQEAEKDMKEMHPTKNVDERSSVIQETEVRRRSLDASDPVTQDAQNVIVCPRKIVHTSEYQRTFTSNNNLEVKSDLSKDMESPEILQTQNDIHPKVPHSPGSPRSSPLKQFPEVGNDSSKEIESSDCENKEVGKEIYARNIPFSRSSSHQSDVSHSPKDPSDCEAHEIEKVIYPRVTPNTSSPSLVHEPKNLSCDWSDDMNVPDYVAEEDEDDFNEFNTAKFSNSETSSCYESETEDVDASESDKLKGKENPHMKKAEKIQKENVKTNFISETGTNITCDMDSSENILQTCQNSDVPTKMSSDQDKSSEVPIRNYPRLRDCHVVLRRLTEEEIYCSYACEDDVNYEVINQTEDLLNRTVQALDDANDYVNNHLNNYERHINEKVIPHRVKKRNVRDISKLNKDIFERYKQKRQLFKEKQNRISLNFENSLDMSQDEFKTYDSPSYEKKKKRIKRGRKYERDSEWSPYTGAKSVGTSSKKLKRQVRRPIIESDSSTSDEDDLLYSYYAMNDAFSDSNSSAFQNTVPSEFGDSEPSALSSLSIHKTFGESVQENDITVNKSKISSPNFKNDSNTGPGHSNNTSDIVSEIMKEMDQCKGTTTKLTNRIKNPNTVLNKPAYRKEMPMQKRNKILKRPFEDRSLFETDRKTVVSNVLREMVHTICTQESQLVESHKFSKKCKWCHTVFSTSKETETMCAICYDNGFGKFKTNMSAKNCKTKLKGSVKQKTVGTNKVGRKVSNTMSRVLKNLPKNEMHRLMYAEKKDKSSVEKSYNHCKSFITPKDTGLAEDCSNNVNKPKQMAIQKKTQSNMGENYISKLINKSTIQKISQGILKSVSDQVNGSKKTTEKSKDSAKSSNENVSLEKFNDGLFLMSFPEPDKELNKSQSSAIQNKNIAVNVDTYNGSRATNILGQKSLEISSQSEANDEQYKTYLLPPVPTVVVANYSSTKDKSGDYRLLNVFYQNEFTKKDSVRNSVASVSPKSLPVATEKTNLNNTPLLKNTLLSTNNITYQSCPTTTSNLLQSNRPLTITSIPIRNIQPKPPLTSPIMSLGSTAVTNKQISILPIVSSVISLSDKSNNQSSVVTEPSLSTFPHNLFASNNNFVNSEQLQIKITHVSSENEEANKTAIESRSSNLKSSDASHSENISKISNSSFPSPSIINQVISGNSSENSTEKRVSPSTNTTLDQRRASKIEIISAVACTDSFSKENTSSTTISECRSVIVDGRSDESGQKSIVEKMVIENEGNSVENCAIKEKDDLAKQSSENPNSDKESDKNVNNDKNSNDPLNSAVDLLGAISILAVIDLEKNPSAGLKNRIHMVIVHLEKLRNMENIDAETREKIVSHEHDLSVLHLAKKFLNLYGSFARVSDHFLQKEKLIQIKKEMLSEEEVSENSCRFSQRSQSTDSYNNDSEPSRTPDITSPLSIKSETFSSCRLNEKSASINHIEKLQSQIAAMNSNQMVNYDPSISTGTVHHFPTGQITMSLAAAAPTPVTPRNDYMAGGESRETPSRGSGPRTPARPESATSQPEEQALTALQIKKERLEAASPSPPQCAFTQNSTLSHISSQLPNITEINPSLNMTGHVMNSNIQQVNNMQQSVNNSHQILTNNPVFREVAPNRTVIATNNNFNSSNNQNFSNMLLNISSNPQISPNSAPGMNPAMQQNRQVVIGQSVYVNPPNMAQKQTVPSVNNSQYVVRPPYTSNVNGGTVLVNPSQMGGQNVSALLTNVSNQQFYTSKQQVTQLYYPPASQINSVPNNMSSIVSNVHNQQVGTESLDQMVCAVCKNVATLRCKQCAKVAYCNTSCAKTYWHQRHKMECKPMQS